MVQPTPNPSLRERFNISRLAIAHPWLTVGFWIAVTVAGLLAFSSLKYALFPDITFPVVVVNAKITDETTLTTEQQLTQPIEEQLQTLEGVEVILSSTYPSQTAVTLNFAVGRDLQASVEQVEAALAEVDLPPQATVEVIPFNLNESSVISYAITSDTQELSELIPLVQDEIIPPIAELPGVLKANLLGDADITSGSLSSDTEFANAPTLVHFNGEEALALQVIKQGDANTLDVVSRVEEEMEVVQSQVPQVQLTLAATQADYIREATQATIDALILAIILAVLVIFPFLRNLRATLITALAIPISLLGTCIVMALYGFNLETITLLALALVIGIIVDDAIVDVENISRHIDEGQTPRQAAIIATNEIGLTVSASTLTIVAVFLPVAFMGGTIGQFFKPFGVTVSAAVLISLLVARTLSPVLAVWWLKPKPNRVVSEEGEELELAGFTRQYRNLLHWALHHRTIVVGIALISFMAGVALIPLIPQGFIPKLDRGEFNVSYTIALPEVAPASPPQAEPQNEPSLVQESLTDVFNSFRESPLLLLWIRSREVARQLETAIVDVPEVESVFTVIGGRGEANTGQLHVQLEKERQLTTSEVQQRVREVLPQLEGVTTSVEDIQFVELPTQKPVQIALLGDDLAQLSRSIEQLQARVEALPGFVDVAVSGTVDEQGEIVELNRFKGQRAVYLSANLDEDVALGNATDRVVEIAQEVAPEGVRLELLGDSDVSNDVLGSFGRTLVLSVILMLVVLIIPFGRLLEPLVVGLSLPLSIVGAMLGLLVTRSDFGMISLIGLIFLLGLLDKNALLLMDYANQLRRRGGWHRTEAILRTGVVRLRPILMTTFSTILGMLPIALGWGAGAQLRQPMAVAIIGGLLTSTLLSLIVVPVLYVVLEDGWGRVYRKRLWY